jgi:hypothetical protein
MHYSYRRTPTGQDFFVPAGTLIAVKLLSYNLQLPKYHYFLTKNLSWFDSISNALAHEFRYSNDPKRHLFWVLNTSCYDPISTSLAPVVQSSSDPISDFYFD